MKLPEIDSYRLPQYRPYRYKLDIPEVFEFTPHPPEVLEELIAATTDHRKLLAKHQALAEQGNINYTALNPLTMAYMIESDLTNRVYSNTIPEHLTSLYTEALLLRIQTMHIDYPMLLAVIFAHSIQQKTYTYRDFSAAYYLYCLLQGLPGNYTKLPTEYKELEELRRKAYAVTLNVTPIEDTLCVPYDTFDWSHVHRDIPPLPKCMYIYGVSADIRLPFYVFSRWNTEKYFVTPLYATTANKLLKLYELPVNNLLTYHTAEETSFLNLQQCASYPNFDLCRYTLFPLPEFIEINTLLGLPETHKKADMFLKYPIVRKNGYNR